MTILRKIISLLMRPKQNLLEGVSLTAFHKQSMPVKHGGESVMVWGCCAASGRTCRNGWNEELCSLQEHPEGEELCSRGQQAKAQQPKVPQLRVSHVNTGVSTKKEEQLILGFI